MNLNLGKLVLDGKCHVMGILNVTPDSFYDGGLHFDLEDTHKRVEAMTGRTPPRKESSEESKTNSKKNGS